MGVDGDGAAHYWDSYEFAVAVVAADGESEKVVLANTPFETLAEWCEYTRGERGWGIGPHVGGSLLGNFVRSVEALHEYLDEMEDRETFKETVVDLYLDDEIGFDALKEFVGRQDAESVRASKALLEQGNEMADDFAQL